MHDNTGEPNELRYAREYIKLDVSTHTERAAWHLPCDLQHPHDAIHPRCTGKIYPVVAVVMSIEPPQPFCRNCERIMVK